MDRLPQAINFKDTLVLDTNTMQHFIDAFTPGMTVEERKDPKISPFYADLTGLKLPPAIFTCGTEDLLLEDTVMMATRWQIAGAVTIVKLYPGEPHGFIAFPGTNTNACVGDVLTFLKEQA